MGGKENVPELLEQSMLEDLTDIKTAGLYMSR